MLRLQKTHFNVHKSTLNFPKGKIKPTCTKAGYINCAKNALISINNSVTLPIVLYGSGT